MLAGDLLDLARLESGHLAIAPALIDLSDLITDAVDRRAAETGKDLTIGVTMPAHLVLHADRTDCGRSPTT